MRIYGDTKELMTETGRNLYEMGLLNAPKTYQNKAIEGNPEFITKELICTQYSLSLKNLHSIEDFSPLFIFDPNSKEWADREFEERISSTPVNPGEAWKFREGVWAEFLNEEGEFDYTYNQRMNFVDPNALSGASYLNYIIELLLNDRNTRKAVLSIFSPSDYVNFDGKRRIPCSMYYNFLIREDAYGTPRLDILYHQRSSDFVTHFGNDVYLAAKLNFYIAEQTGVLPGRLIHTIDSLHVYRKDWDALRVSLGKI